MRDKQEKQKLSRQCCLQQIGCEVFCLARNATVVDAKHLALAYPHSVSREEKNSRKRGIIYGTQKESSTGN